MSEEYISVRRGGSSICLNSIDCTSTVHCGNVNHSEGRKLHISAYKDSIDRGVNYQLRAFIDAQEIKELAEVLDLDANDISEAQDVRTYMRRQLRQALASINSARLAIRKLKDNYVVFSIDSYLSELNEAFVELNKQGGNHADS